jgi:hypothetical protein
MCDTQQKYRSPKVAACGEIFEVLHNLLPESPTSLTLSVGFRQGQIL